MEAENELDRITNQCILERLLQTYQLLHSPELAHDLPEYGCAFSYEFQYFQLAHQLSCLTRLNTVCALLFARNMSQLILYNQSFFCHMQRQADNVAACIVNIVKSQELLVKQPQVDMSPFPVGPVMSALMYLLRAHPETPLTPVLMRLMRFSRLIESPRARKRVNVY